MHWMSLGSNPGPLSSQEALAAHLSLKGIPSVLRIFSSFVELLHFICRRRNVTKSWRPPSLPSTRTSRASSKLCRRLVTGKSRRSFRSRRRSSCRSTRLKLLGLDSFENSVNLFLQVGLQRFIVNIIKTTFIRGATIWALSIEAVSLKKVTKVSSANFVAVKWSQGFCFLVMATYRLK